MRNPFIKFLKQYMYFSKRDRNAIVIFVILIILGIVVNEIIKSIPSKSDYDYFKFAKEFEEWQKSQIKDEKNSKSLFPFNPNTISENALDSLILPDFVIQNLLNYRKAGGEFSNPSDLRKIYGMNDSIFHEIKPFIVIPKNNKVQATNNLYKDFEPKGTFDPNTSDENTLEYFGFNKFQTENIIHYREKGGEFHVKGDLLKIYGIDTLFFNKIVNHILIKNAKLPEPYKADSLIIIELNKTDSAQLTQLAGIGPVYASRIIKYRDILGGFYDCSQLLEVYNLTEETYQKIKEHIKVDTTQLNKIRINFAEYKELIRHPYLNGEKVNLILNYRDRNGPFRNILQLKDIPGFDTLSFKKISPYISCR